METKKEISILVPIYNVEKYLSRCIESVLSQNFIDYELILVDDGSPDRSGEICDRYAKKHSDKIKVIHKENGGLPSARLAGFQNAKGKYIMFLDSDDFLLPNSLLNLYNKINEGYDIVKGNNWRYIDNNSYTIEKPNILNKEICSPEEYISNIISYNILPYLWGGLYKKELFSEEIFKKIRSISICEDWITNQLIWQKVNKYFTIDIAVCSYYINPKSMMQDRVISFNYHKKLYKLMLENVGNNNALIDLINLQYKKSLIRSFFIPEIGWNNEIYKDIATFIKEKEHFNKLKQSFDNKFLFGINFKFFFKTYTHIYRILFKYIKLKGETRKVLS